jgi:hypothetical protein
MFSLFSFRVPLYPACLPGGWRGVLSRGIGVLLPLLVGVPAVVSAAEPEVVPPLGADLEEHIRNRPPAEARVASGPGGNVQLEINGEPEPLMVGGIKGFVAHDKMRVKVWRDAGYNLVFVCFDLGYMSSHFGYVSPPLYNRSFWDGPGRYVSEDVEKVLWRVLRVYPDAKIILWPWIDVYPEWANEHPGELMRNEKGQGFVVKNHFERVGDDPDPKKKERLAWSFFSQVFRKEAGEMLAEFVRTVETSVPGRQVVGYVLGGGQDAQLYAWDPPDYALQNNPALWADYSEPARAAWKAWLQKEYGTEAQLSRAWNVKIESFAAAEPPKAADLVGPQPYHDPVKERREIDWLRFLAEGRAELCSHFAAVVRKAVQRPVLVGVSGGDGGARYAMTATGKLLRDPNIDLLWHQATYGAERRLPPATGGINAMLGSHSLHRKLFMADMDQRTWVTKPIGGGQAMFGVISMTDKSVGRAQDMEQLRAMWRRELGQLWSNGAGPMFHPLIDPDTYEDDAIKEELKFLRAEVKDFQPAAMGAGAGDLTVIYDEQSVSYLKGALAQRHLDWTDRQQSELNASGVPYRAYYADDLREGRVPPSKMYLFVNLLNLDEPLRQAIGKLKKAGATLVWLQGAGFAQAAQSDLVSQTLGLSVTPLSGQAEVKDMPATPVAGPLPGLDEKSLSRDAQIGWRVTDPGAQGFAVYPSTTEVGAAMKEHENWKSVFIGAHVLDRGAVNALAKIAGAWRLAPAGNVVSAGRGWIGVHPLQDGEVELHLQAPSALEAVWPETLSLPPAQDHKATLRAGKTYLFRTNETLTHAH